MVVILQLNIIGRLPFEDLSEVNIDCFRLHSVLCDVPASKLRVFKICVFLRAARGVKQFAQPHTGDEAVFTRPIYLAGNGNAALALLVPALNTTRVEPGHLDILGAVSFKEFAEIKGDYDGMKIGTDKAFNLGVLKVRLR